MRFSLTDLMLDCHANPMFTYTCCVGSQLLQALVWRVLMSTFHSDRQPNQSGTIRNWSSLLTSLSKHKINRCCWYFKHWKLVFLLCNSFGFCSEPIFLWLLWLKVGSSKEKLWWLLVQDFHRLDAIADAEPTPSKHCHPYQFSHASDSLRFSCDLMNRPVKSFLTAMLTLYYKCLYRYYYYYFVFFVHPHNCSVAFFFIGFHFFPHSELQLPHYCYVPPTWQTLNSLYLLSFCPFNFTMFFGHFFLVMPKNNVVD